MEQHDSTNPATNGPARKYPSPRSVTLIILVIVVEAMIVLAIAYKILKGTS